MKAYRTEIISALLISLVIIGAVVFFFSRFKEKQREQMDLYDLILPEVKQVLSINKPFLFSEALKHQPELNTYFQTFIPEDYWDLFAHVKRTPVLLVYYPQGVVMHYHLQHERDEVSSCFQGLNFVPVKKRDIHLAFYPKTSSRYLGKYRHEGIGVISSSRKLLETIADNHQNKKETCLPSLKQLREKVDKGALLNALFQPDSTSGWQSVDLFLHEEQICCLYNQTRREQTDSLIAVNADSLTILIEKTIPGLKVQSGLSKDNTTVYYTFCTTSTPASDISSFSERK